MTAVIVKRYDRRMQDPIRERLNGRAGRRADERAGDQPRDRMVRSAATLIARDGLRGAGMRDVADAAGVSRGSFQHYFPGGKDQLTAEALSWMGAAVHERLDRAAERRSPGGGPTGALDPGGGTAVDVLDAFVDLWRQGLIDTAMTTGCSIAATVHDSDDATLLALAAGVFASWCSPFRTALRAEGRPDDQADALATTAVAALEGAVILCRARHDLVPLDQTAAVLRVLLSGSSAG